MSLGEEFLNDVLSLIPVLSVSADFGEELLSLMVLSVKEGGDADLDDAPIEHSLSVVVTVVDDVGHVAGD